MEAPSAPMPQRQTMTAAMRAEMPVSVNMIPLNTTCPIISTSTTRIALSPLLKMAEISSPMALDATSMSRIETKISTLVSSSK